MSGCAGSRRSTHSVEAALSGAAAGREVDIAVRTNLEIGDRHRLAVDELGEILAARVGRAVGVSAV